ncbi:hypothetical protein F0344_14655 [Streptomyces finlayi]|uniref:Uncharacterized protein n=1 Tax=Streptomyces finlayi TaxID=67296 RepID=A0A7G7BK38_9ACTN|nr:hypothetical protein [Streptomyces finlayi]QNE75703.1 hypothetical protein F0344_14655 [Streptomyces finlayi]
MTQVRTAHAPPGSRTGVADGTITTLVAALQLGVVLAGAVTVGMTGADAYDRPTGSSLGMLFVLVLGPPVAAVLGALHTVAVSMPAALGATAAARRLPAAPEWLLLGAFLVVLGALYAVPASLMGASYVTAWAAIAVSGVLPLLGVAYRVRREGQGRPIGLGGVWLCALAAGLVLLVVTVTGCVVALQNGWTDGTREVPDLSARQVAGVWESVEGQAEMRLGADGRALLAAVPYEPAGGTELRCDGEGTWTYTPVSGDVRGSVTFDSGCELGAWTLGGTTERPELYALFGDPDTGDVRALVKRA